MHRVFSVALVALLAGLARPAVALSSDAGPAAPALGTVTEFAIEYPGHAQLPEDQAHAGSTHEITFRDPGGDRFWITGQNDDAVVEMGTDGKVAYHAMPKGSGPHGIAFDGSGRLFVTFEFLGEIAVLAPDGRIVARHDIGLNCKTCAGPINPRPHGLAIDPDGKTVWYTNKLTDTIGRLRPDGTVQTFALGTVGSVPIYIRSGPDGNMWFTELVGNAIGRVTPDGVVREFPIPTPASRPIAIVPDPGGKAMWFSEEAGNKVGRIAMDGTITEFAVPKTHGDAILAGLAFDSESNLWVQQYVSKKPGVSGTDYVVRIDKAIASASGISGIPMTFFALPGGATVMHRIIKGPDGNMWFTELGPDRAARIETR